MSVNRLAWARWVVPMVSVAMAAAVRVGLLSALGHRLHWITFYPAVMLAAMQGGMLGGLLATLLSGVAALLWRPPLGPPLIQDAADWLGVAVFAASGAMIAGVCEAMHRAQRRATEAEAQNRQMEERREAEAAFATQRQFYETILTQAAEGIVVRDLAGRITFANAVALGKARVSPASVGVAEAEAIWGETRDAQGQLLPVERWPIVRALQGETTRGVELYRTGQDGMPYVLLVSTTPLRDGTGQIRGAASIQTDVTARKRAEAELATEKALLEAILEQAADPMLVVSPDHTFLRANSAARALCGEDPRGKPFAEVLSRVCPTPDRGGPALSLQAYLVCALDGQVARNAGSTLRRSDGVWGQFLINAAPIRGAGGEVAAAVAVLTDITAEKQSEARLRAALAEKEAALGDKETLLREVHHRTKNNLQMLCSLLELQAEAIDSPEGKEALLVSTDRIYAIARLYEQLYRSMSSGQVLLCDYLAGLAQTFQKTHDGSKLVFHLPVCEGIALDVERAIPCGLILNELFTNAVKHAFPSGVSGEIGAEVKALGDRIQLRVWDNGRGLPAGLDLERTTSLGLRLVRILGQRLGAEIEVATNGGLAFTFTFPGTPET